MRLRTLVLLCVLASPAAAQDSTITLWKREVITSSRLREERALFVATPEGYRDGTSRHGVLIMLDANDRPQFNLALAHMAFHAHRGLIPSLIVVGIPNGNHRTRDMTPAATGETAK